MSGVRPGSVWDADVLDRYEGWRFTVPDAVRRELEQVAQRAEKDHTALDEAEVLGLDLPHLSAFVGGLDAELRHGTGVAYVSGLDVEDESLFRCSVVTLGILLGGTIDTYGRLYDVVDGGHSYKEKAIPVSQTRAATGMHTDSSRVETWPELIALACIRPAASGGESRIASVGRAVQVMRAQHPELLERLRQSFVRDIVTPGSDRSPEEVRLNRFPIVCSQDPPTLRYMRYWIEQGHSRIGEPLGEQDVAALDCLDGALEHPSAVVHFRMSAGELFFANNRTTVHDRTAYLSTPGEPRHLLRLWIRERAAS